MGFLGFVSWFIGGLMITVTLHILFKNIFITAFVVGMIMGILGAKE